MNLTYCNTTTVYEEIDETPLFSNWTFHYLGLWISAGFGLIATLSSLYLMWMHATHYSRPWEQKHILRILFMVPIYSVVSFLSFRFYLHTIYFAVLRDTYEAFAIASFFALMCHYVAPTLHEQKEYFRELKSIKPWVWPVSWMRKCCGGERGCLRTPRSGLTWFNIIWLCVFQYCFIRVSMTVTAVTAQVFGRYCQESLSPVFAHIWVLCIESICVTIAMFCLIQFYVQLRTDEGIARNKPFMKVLSIKLVIFLSFWQTITISLLTSSGALKPSPRIANPDLRIGIPAMLLCIEMAFFSILHLWAYPWRVYVLNHNSHTLASSSAPNFHIDGPNETYKGGRFGLKAFLDIFNPWDLFKAIGRGFRWLFIGRKHREQDISYQSHLPSNTNPSIAIYKPGKPGKYVPLHDNDSDANVPFVQHEYPHPFTQQGQQAFGKPLNSSRGDLGAVGLVERGYDREDEEEFRPHGALPSGGTAYARQEDTAYYAAQGRQHWADPRSHWGGTGNGGQI